MCTFSNSYFFLNCHSSLCDFQLVYARVVGTVVPGVQWFVWRSMIQSSSASSAAAAMGMSDQVNRMEKKERFAGESVIEDTWQELPTESPPPPPVKTTGPLSDSYNQSPFASGVRILCTIRDLASPASAFAWDGSWFGHPGTELIDFYSGTETFRNMMDNKFTADAIIEYYKKDAEIFRQRRQQFLLY